MQTLTEQLVEALEEMVERWPAVVPGGPEGRAVRVFVCSVAEGAETYTKAYLALDRARAEPEALLAEAGQARRQEGERREVKPPSVDVSMEHSPCGICSTTLACCWTDHHGIGACLSCGAPYKIIHYDDSKKRIDKPPELLIQEKWREKMRQYWSESHRNVAPGAFNVPGSTYEVATNDDVRSLNEWVEREGLPA